MWHFFFPRCHIGGLYMQQLHRFLRQLMEESGESISSLSAKAHMDRPTLSKIMSGNRFPSENNMKSLIPVLKISPSQRYTLMSLFFQGHEGSEKMQQRKYIQSLLETVFSFEEDNNKYPHLTSDHPFFIDGQTCMVLHSQSSIEIALEAFILHFLKQNSGFPIMLGEKISPGRLHILSGLLHTTEHSTVEIWQLASLSKDPSQMDPTFNLRRFGEALPFVFQKDLNFSVRYHYRNPDFEPSLTEFFPEKILFPDAVFMISPDGQHACLNTSAEYVSYCREQFETLFQYDSIPFLYQQDSSDFLTALNLAHEHDQECRHSIYLQYQPPFPVVGDINFIQKYLLGSISDYNDIKMHLLHRLSDIQSVPFQSIFSEKGLQLFVQTGRLCELPSEWYQPLPMEARATFLDRLIVYASQNKNIFLINSSAFQLNQNISINIIENKDLIMYRHVPEEKHVKICSFKESSVVDAFEDFGNYLISSHLTFSSEETIRILHQYRNSLLYT